MWTNSSPHENVMLIFVASLMNKWYIDCIRTYWINDIGKKHEG